MLNSTQELTALLKGTPLENGALEQLPILDTGEQALAVHVPLDRMFESWQILRSRLPQTGRWPVLVRNEPAEELFSRFYYGEEGLAATDPRSVIASMPEVDLASWQSAAMADQPPWRELLDYNLDCLSANGEVPSKSEVEAAMRGRADNDGYFLQRWLWDWRWQRLGPNPEAQSAEYMAWWAPGQTPSREVIDVCLDSTVRRKGVLSWLMRKLFGKVAQVAYRKAAKEELLTDVIILLLPTAHSWETLAYLHWYGEHTTARMALLKKWQLEYGAELVMHGGVNIELVVERPPTSRDAAFSLAVEHDLAARDTLEGVTVYHHAECLMHAHRWALMECP